MITLSDRQTKSLTRLFDGAMVKAAQSLAGFSGEPVEARVGLVRFLDYYDLVQTLDPEGRHTDSVVCSVGRAIEGASRKIEGQALMLVREPQARKIALAFPTPPQADNAAEAIRAGMREVGNVLIGASMGEVMQACGQPLRCGGPEVRMGTYFELLAPHEHWFGRDNSLLLLYVMAYWSKLDVDVHLVFLMPPAAARALAAAAEESGCFSADQPPDSATPG